jgi:hypothetical protein
LEYAVNPDRLAGLQLSNPALEDSCRATRIGIIVP